VALFQQLLECGYPPEAWTVVGTGAVLLGTLVGRWVSLNRVAERATAGRYDSPDPSTGGDKDSPSAHAERLATIVS
jgi:hypothetical protein